jgi:hypothetical protein
MFLIALPFSPYTTILHTGDLRADDGFMQEIIKNPWVQPYLRGYPVKRKQFSGGTVMRDERLPPQHGFRNQIGLGEPIATQNTGPGICRQLERIYLDTSTLVGSCEMPSRADAIANLISIINQYPSDTIFHLNCWTFGYEEVLKALAKTYNTRIHLDRWQLQNYSLLYGDPLLQELGTSSDDVYFHACDGSRRCCGLKWDKFVVDIEFVETGVSAYASKMETHLRRLKNAKVGKCKWPNKIVSIDALDLTNSTWAITGNGIY